MYNSRGVSTMFGDVDLDTLSSMRVLYVEDDIETRDELEIFLKALVAELYVAENGREGLALYRQHYPDIVISDIQMPIMNGLSMSADIRQLRPEQAIVILSAYNDVEYLFRAMELGIQNYVTKPISTKRLVQQLITISEKLLADRQLKHQRQLLDQYKLLTDEKAIIAKFDLTGRFTYVNQRFCTLSGYAETELFGQDFRQVCLVENQTESISDLRKQLCKKGKWNGILKSRTKQGNCCILDITVMASYNELHKVSEYLALMLDVSEMFEQQELLSCNLKADLQQQKHLLSEYKRALDLGTTSCVMDLQGKILNVNRNFCQSFHCQMSDLLGQSFFNMVQENKSFKPRLLSQIQKEGHVAKVVNLRFADEDKYLSAIFVAIYDNDGIIHSIQVLCQDITESIRLNEEIMDTQKELIYVLGEVVENRSQETGQHLKRVAKLSNFLAEKYGLDHEQSEMIKIAAPMHDIGKVGISDQILHKQGKLTESEFAIMKTHPELGYKILKDLQKPLVKMAARIALEHHEHFNGKGYPFGLKGENISIEGRIVALVDVFDALSSKRVYKTPWNDDEIISYIKAQRGMQFDPALVDLFELCFPEIISIRNQFRD